ncbi:MAG: hypothetical protein ABW085_15560 [Sedimenticola sp.]
MAQNGFTSFNDEERLALDYLPLKARVLYLLLLKVHMDRDTRIVGIRRRISRKAMQELLEVHRQPGSTIPPETPSIKEIRTALKQLGRAGLIRRVKGYENTLVFFLPLATPKVQTVDKALLDNSASQSRGRGEAEQGPHSKAPSNPCADAGSEKSRGQGAAEERPHSSGPHPISNIQYHSVAAAVPDPARERVQLRQVLLELFPDQQNQIDNNQRAQQMLDTWCAAGVSTHHIRRAHKEMSERPGVGSFGPVYLRGLVLELSAAEGLQGKRDRNAELEEQADRDMRISVERWAKERGLTWNPLGREAYSAWLERMRRQRLDERKGGGHG